MIITEGGKEGKIWRAVCGVVWGVLGGEGEGGGVRSHCTGSFGEEFVGYDDG